MLGCRPFIGHHSGIDCAAEPTAFDLPPELARQIRKWVAQAADVPRLEAELKASKRKIEALVHELAVLKRLRFGARSEALAANVKDLFDETLAADVAACEARLEALRAAPLYARLAELLREGAVLHADETPVAQLDPGNGKTKRAYLWAYRGNALGADPPIIVFDYPPGRGGHYPRALLKDWVGMLMVDDSAGDVAAEDMWPCPVSAAPIRARKRVDTT